MIPTERQHEGQKNTCNFRNIADSGEFDLDTETLFRSFSGCGLDSGDITVRDGADPFENFESGKRLNFSKF